ncbi:MAG: GNAT family N-acetyltransferase [Paracoccus sp. (in: a-proteobacteria)]|uniref:GNAT family N-acetyltransferase n=1 Tax=Paracoccus sp. TaxID=267 RepID=UPI0026DEC48A|nr:GNAT family N-acetyltransferase [Paracoccus sp. (in: a-proteobacteria)]MDO5621587.1 GNAT family N-acetyltransferase [Paracoccus sp. (in: a-proteobacteria)]
MTDPAIRRLTPQDAAEWRDLRLEMLRLAPHAFSSRLVDWQDRPLADFAARLEQARAFVTGPQGQAGEGQAGAVALWEPAPDVPLTALILSVYTRPDARGQGLAGALIRHILQDAAQAGMTRATLRVMRDNPTARRLYERLGFQPDPATSDARQIGMMRPLSA